jgi:hypothetical protein
MIKAVLRKVECPYCKYKLVEISEEDEPEENIVQNVNVQVFNNIEFPENDDDDSDFEGESAVRTTRTSYSLRSGIRQIPSMESFAPSSLQIPASQLSGEHYRDPLYRVHIQNRPRFIELPNPNFIAVRVIRHDNKKNKKNKNKKKLIEKNFLQKAINEIKLIEHKVKNNANKKYKKEKINKNRCFKF